MKLSIVSIGIAALLAGGMASPAMARKHKNVRASNHTHKTISQTAGNGGNASANGGAGGSAQSGPAICAANGVGLGLLFGGGANLGSCNSVAAGGDGGMAGDAEGGDGGSNINLGSQGDIGNGNATAAG
ncbi:MAG: hypothetical protein LC792_05450 [Actinobacteria bacterium]|nr:hypothetical protein [Actinomycetota bacterium]